MERKFFTCILLIALFLTDINASFATENAVSNPENDRRTKNRDYFDYCMSHRDYGINIFELEEHAFVSDLNTDEFHVDVKPSCNFSIRLDENDIRGIVIHYTNGSAEGAYSWWQIRYPGTSAHYIIRRDGSVIQSVPEAYAAFHLGCGWNDEFCKTCPAVLCDNNGYFYDPAETTIAIELENAGPVFAENGVYTDIFKTALPENAGIFLYDGDDPRYHASNFYEEFPDQQLASLDKLITELENRYGPLEVLGHSDIMQISVDPGPAFPMAVFSERN